MSPTPVRLCRTLLALVVVSGLGGCNKADPNAPLNTAKVEETAALGGGKTLTTAGVSLTFPKDWQAFDMTQGQMEALLGPLEKQPRGKEMAQTIRAGAASGMVKMLVFDPTSSSPTFMNNANLVVTPGGKGATLDQALDASKQQLAAMGARASTSKVTFPAGEFGRLESHLKDPGGNPYVAIGYVQVHGDEVDVVTFSCPEDQIKPFDEKAQSIMKTFKRS